MSGSIYYLFVARNTKTGRSSEELVVMQDEPNPARGSAVACALRREPGKAAMLPATLSLTRQPNLLEIIEIEV